MAIHVVGKKRPKVVITPYDLNRKDPRYRSGPVIVYRLTPNEIIERYGPPAGISMKPAA